MDLPLSYAVKTAAEFAGSVSPGCMQRVPFSGEDVAVFLGLDGASFIVQLPGDTPSNALPHVGVQWLKDGSAMDAVDCGAGYWGEQSGPWLIDIAVTGAAYPSPMTETPFCTFRAISLARPRWQPPFFTSRRPLTLPEGVSISPEALLAFHAGGTSHRQDVSVDEDIPIACWFQCGQHVQMGDDILAVARSSALACVVYLRFQVVTAP